MPHLSEGAPSRWGSWPRLALASVAALAVSCSSGPYEYGAICSETVPCTGGLLCVTAFPGGYCTSRCGSGVACAPGGVCDPDLVDGLCLEACATAADCRDGYQCWNGGCRPECTADGDCGAGAVCASGQCMGTECTMDSECPSGACRGGLCVELPDAGMPDVPRADGGTIPDGAACGASSECVSGLCLPADRGGICTRSCADASACFDAVTFSAGCAPAVIDGSLQTVCVPFDSTGLADASPCSSDDQCASQTCAEGLCTEVCDAATDCLAGERCTSLPWSGRTFMGCGYPPRVGAVEILQIDLGSQTIPAMSGTTGLTFGVPADAISATLRAERISGAAVDLAFYSVAAPSGTSLYSLADFSDLIDQPIRWYPVDGGEAISMLVPNTTADRFAFQIGRYPYGVAAYGPSGSASVRFSVLVKRADRRMVTSGRLDLAVHLVGVGITAATAPSNTRLSAMLDRMDTILSQVGITLGTVTFHDVTGATATRLQVIDSTDGATSELAELFRLSAGRPANVLPLFLVRSINAGGDGFNTLGIAGGIPGSTGIYGTENSGVVVSFDASVVGSGTGGGVVAGHVASHECSHFLGLFHVTERLRACGPGETPSPTTCVPFGSTDVIDDTTRGDTRNLMNWSIVGGGSNDRVSIGQGFVLLRSPLTH
jgi:hypothetical protein